MVGEEDELLALCGETLQPAIGPDGQPDDLVVGGDDAYGHAVRVPAYAQRVAAAVRHRRDVVVVAVAEVVLVVAGHQDSWCTGACR